MVNKQQNSEKPDLKKPKQNKKNTQDSFKIKFVDKWTKTTKKFKGNRYAVNKRHDSFLLQLTWVVPALTFIALFIFYAVFIVFKNGFNGASSTWFDWFFSTLNFKNIFANKSFLIAIRNSFIYMVTVVPVSLIISILVAKSLSSILNKRMFSFLQGIFFLPYVTSAIAVAMAFSFIFDSRSSGLLNQLIIKLGGSPIAWQNDPRYGLISVLVFGIWKSLPFEIIMLTAAFMRVNKQYHLAASIDGMSKTKQFFRISIPQIMPMILYLFTMGLINSFKALPLGLYKDEAAAELANAQTLVFWIYERTTGASGGVVSFQQAGAASIVLLALIFVITVFARLGTRYLAKRYK